MPSFWFSIPLICLAFGTLGASEPCKPIDGIKPLLQPGTVLVLGEIHGTQESPRFALDVACHAAEAGLDVVVGVELSPSDQQRVDRFLASEGTLEDRVSLLAGAQWQSSYQDGRASHAMFELIDGLRHLRKERASPRVAMFDASGRGGGRKRDRAMSANLVETINRAQDALVVVLTGNAHSRTSVGNRRDPEFEPMAYLTRRNASYKKFISLNVGHGGGTTWTCNPNCGISQIGGRRGESPWSIEIDDTTRPAGHDGWYRVGHISASEPAEPRHRIPRPPEPVTPVPPPTETAPSVAEAETIPSGEDDKINGRWQAFDFGTTVKTYRMKFDEGGFSAENGSDEWYVGNIEVWPQESPAHIDFNIKDCRCDFKGMTSKGIYYWDGESLVISARAPGSERPTRFVKTSGDMMRLRRAGE